MLIKFLRPKIPWEKAQYDNRKLCTFGVFPMKQLYEIELPQNLAKRLESTQINLYWFQLTPDVY